jgi:2-phosphosulfolactate phosphatase
MMFIYTNLDTCAEATGLVVAVDVVRAFTTAACAFSRGAQRIHPVSTNEAALDFKLRHPGSLAMGENKGLPPPGFDIGNSPTQVLELDLDGCTLVQRTGAGTPGLTRSVNASMRMAASFVVASATVRYIRALEPSTVTFVITGQTYDGGQEDLACAQYLEACLRGKCPDPAPYMEIVRSCHDAEPFFDPSRPEFLESDITYCTDVDRFSFAMRVEEQEGLPFLIPVHMPSAKGK